MGFVRDGATVVDGVMLWASCVTEQQLSMVSCYGLRACRWCHAMGFVRDGATVVGGVMLWASCVTEQQLSMVSCYGLRA